MSAKRKKMHRNTGAKAPVAAAKTSVTAVKKLQGLLQPAAQQNRKQAQQTLDGLLPQLPEDNTTQLLLGAIAHQLGKTAVAETAFRKSIALNPGQASSHFNLARVLSTRGATEEAIEHFQSALALKNDYPMARMHLGLLFLQHQRLAEAESELLLAHEQDRENFDICNNLGTLYRHKDDSQLAEQWFLRALEIRPDSPLALCSLGSLFQLEGKLEQAFEQLQHALRLAPDLPEAHFNMGSVCNQLEQFDAAQTHYQRAIELRPNFAQAHCNYGNLLQKQGNNKAAIAAYQKAVAIKPDYEKALYNLGLILNESGDPASAVEVMLRVVKNNPQHLDAHTTLGIAFKNLGYPDKALHAFQFVQHRRRDDALANFNLGTVLQDLGRFGEAAQRYRKTIDLEPDNAGAHNNIAGCLQKLGEFEKACEYYEKVLELKPDHNVAHSNYLCCLQYHPSYSPEKNLHEHLRWWDMQGKRVFDASRVPARKTDKQTLRVGIVSPNFGAHPVTYLSVLMLESARDSDIEICLFSDRVHPDSYTERMRKAAARFYETSDLDDEQMAELIRDEGVDILVDINGHFGKNRMMMFARKPAPVQISWLSFGTRGLATLDYIIGDRYHIPEGEDRFFTEKVVRMPHSYATFATPDYDVDPGPLPASSNGFVTFGCFNNPIKISAELIDIWSGIMSRVEHSRLFLKYGGVDDPLFKHRLIQQFENNGIERERLRLEGRSSREALLQCYQEVDIALDTHPYSGGITTCESVWMGVPVVSAPGLSFTSRHSSSHLHNIGYTRSLANSIDGYADTAVAIASDLEALAVDRRELRGRLAASCLNDGDGYFKAFRDTLWTLWR